MTFEDFRRGIGVGKGLKVGNELFCFIPPGKESFALQNLVGQRYPSIEGTGTGTTGVAVDTPSSGNGAIPIGAVQPGINSYLMNPATKKGLKVCVEVIIPFAH